MHRRAVPDTRPTHPARITRPVTVILRLVPDAAREGRIAGRLEIVDTGESLPIRQLSDLVEIVRALAAED